MPFTPGPWKLNKSRDGKKIVIKGNSSDYFIDLTCLVDSDDKDQETAQANAYLIVAAPELLAFAKTILKRYDDNPEQSLNSTITQHEISTLRQLVSEATKEP